MCVMIPDRDSYEPAHWSSSMYRQIWIVHQESCRFDGSEVLLGSAVQDKLGIWSQSVVTLLDKVSQTSELRRVCRKQIRTNTTLAACHSARHSIYCVILHNIFRFYNLRLVPAVRAPNKPKQCAKGLFMNIKPT